MRTQRFSALQRAEIAEIRETEQQRRQRPRGFSALQRAEIAEIILAPRVTPMANAVSVLFNEPKLLKSQPKSSPSALDRRFSALQRAEIAEIQKKPRRFCRLRGFSALQRAEIAEIPF